MGISKLNHEFLWQLDKTRDFTLRESVKRKSRLHNKQDLPEAIIGKGNAFCAFNIIILHETKA